MITPYSNKDVLDAIEGVYQEWCEFEARRDGCHAVRLPDFEDAIFQLKLHLEKFPLTKPSASEASQ